jgi:hypothetical protein
VPGCLPHGLQIVHALDPLLLRGGKLREHFSDGASSSFFCRSVDQTLIVKTVSAAEVEELLALLPDYVRHLAANPCSFLSRFYGCFALRQPSASRVYFILMGNAFPVTAPGAASETYDLKGSTGEKRARLGLRARCEPSVLPLLTCASYRHHHLPCASRLPGSQWVVGPASPSRSCRGTPKGESSGAARSGRCVA